MKFLPVIIFILSSTSILTFIPIFSHSLPFVIFHGVSENCNHKHVKQITDFLVKFSGSQGYCLEIGNGIRDSWFMPLFDQAEIACKKVKEMRELRNGYNIVGLSQGNLLGRSIIEFCDEGPAVKNFISLAGPHAGQASIPGCGFTWSCVLVDSMIKSKIYSNYLQEHLAPAGYIKIPTAIDEYMENCKFLPKLNNEMVDYKNITYKERFASLENLILIMFDGDKILVPKETSLFGYYQDGSWNKILSAQETKLYKEDWIGLKTLDEAGKVKFITVSGGHLKISNSDMKKYMVPYLKDEQDQERSARSSIVKSPLRVKSSWFME